MRSCHFGPARAKRRAADGSPPGRKAEDHDRTATAHRQPKQLDAGILQAEINSFALHLASGNKSAKTIRTYTEAVQWFAAAHLLQQDSRDTWEQP